MTKNDRKIFIDAGANIGQSVDNFMKNWKDWEEYEIYSFECLPKLHSHFDRFESNPKFNFRKEAVWIYDGEIYFYSDGGNMSSSLLKEKKTGRLDKNNPLIVPCVDISKWIRDNFSKDDYIVFKLDTEGGEYETLDKLINDNTFEMVDELYIEFHTNKVGKTEKDNELLLNRMKKFTNLKVVDDSGYHFNFIGRKSSRY